MRKIEMESHAGATERKTVENKKNLVQIGKAEYKI